jgi:upstream activation factor subunit UAF30
MAEHSRKYIAPTVAWAWFRLHGVLSCRRQPVGSAILSKRNTVQVIRRNQHLLRPYVLPTNRGGVYVSGMVGVYHAMALASLTRRIIHMATPKKSSSRKAAAKSRARGEGHTGTGRSQGLQKAVRPSAELAAIVGQEPLPRTEITKKLWDYIKGHGLQDAQNKRQIHADATLEPIFGGKKSVSMFELAKLVSQHVQ